MSIVNKQETIDMPLQLTREDLERIGLAAYGPNWQSAMARDLGHSAPRNVQRWFSGARSIPGDLSVSLAAALRDRGRLLIGMAAKLDGEELP